MIIPGIDIKKLNKVIDAYSICTDIPITVFDKEMNLVAESMADKKFCKFFNIYNEDGICRKSLSFSSKTSFKLGEPYIFLCPSGLLNIVVALISNKEFKGSVVAGPIAMGLITEKNITNAIKLNNIDSSMYMPISIFVREMKIFSPDKINKLALLLYNNILSLYSNIEDYILMNNKQKIQNSTGRKIQEIKQNKSDFTEIKNIKEELVEMIQKGDTYGTNLLLYKFINEILMIYAGSFEIMKVKVFELYLLLSMTALKKGLSIDRLFDLNFNFIESLNKVSNIKEMTSCTVEMTDSFCENIFKSMYSGKSDTISEVVQIIGEKYTTKITLQDLASHFNVSVSSLSRLFKKELDMSFSDFLNKVRIEKSLELIRNSNMTISEVATATGFSDQSYFTKKFNKQMGESPKRYSMKTFK